MLKMLFANTGNLGIVIAACKQSSMQHCSTHTFPSDVHSRLLVDRQVLDAVCGDNSDIGCRNLFATFGLFAGHHPGLHIPVKSVNSP